MVALTLAKTLRAHWIANWNDPYPTQRYPAPYGGGLSARLGFWGNGLLEEIAKHAAWHTFPCERLRDYMLSYFPSSIRDRTSIVPHIAQGNGTGCAPKPVGSGGMRIVFAGKLLPPRRVDLFAAGLRLFVQREGLSPNDVCIEFMGLVSSDLTRTLDNCQVSEYCKLLGSVPYHIAVAEVSRADVGLLLEADCAEGVFLPSKLADYVQCGRPVLAVGPRVGTVRDLITQHGGGIAASSRSAEEIAAALTKMYQAWRRGDLDAKYDVTALKAHFSEEQAVSVFEQILEEIRRRQVQ